MDIEEDFEFLGNTTPDPDEGEFQDDVEEKEDEIEEEGEKEKEEEEEEDKKEEEDVPQKDVKTQALDSERARRKKAERELKELRDKLEAEKNAKEDEENVAKEKESLKKELIDGDIIDEEIADKIVDTLGDRVLKNQIASERRTREEDFDRAFSELKQDELFMDADVYKPQIKELMGKGLTMEQAYFASIGKDRFAQVKKDLEIEAEQKILNSNAKADKVDVGHAESKDEVKRTKYTKKEQEIARMTGLDVKEVHKRSQIFDLDQMLEL